MYITLCPECETTFKVNDEQLALANGWVRCGRCGAVFDGLLQIKQAEAAAQAYANAPTYSESSSVDMPLHAEVADSPFVSKHTPEVKEPYRAGWMVFSLLLTLMLVSQFLLLQRHRLAAEEPAIKDFLRVLCVPFRCKVEWPQDLDYVKIENSSFNEAPGDAYVLQARIKNTQLYAMATPYLELTLTDYQDQVVIRKVFSPVQMEVTDHLGAMRDSKVNLRFSIDPALKPRISGYRALIFYP